MHIRQAVPEDINELKALYFGTITSINITDYNADQIKAWASTAERTDSLSKKIQDQYFYVLELKDKKIAGFGSLEKSGHLDMMYVHKDFQRQGFATKLLSKIIETTKHLGIDLITVDASITAKPFFERNGFVTIKEQHVSINDVVLINYKMELVV